MRVKITLRCNECKQRNYNTMKNKKNTVLIWSRLSLPFVLLLYTNVAQK